MDKDQTSLGSILIVDDTPNNLRLLTATLRNEGFEVRAASSGQMALLVVKTVPFDLILLDISMPDVSGYEVCRQLKADEATEDIPVIFITVLDEMLDKAQAFAVGGVDYVTKPFYLQEVVLRVKTHVNLRRLQQLQHNSQLPSQEASSGMDSFSTLPQAITERLISRQLIADTFAPVTVLCANVVNLVETQISATEAVNLLNQIFALFDQLAEHHHLETTRTFGTTYIAIAGLPTAQTNHAEAAAEMALEMQQKAAQLYLTTKASPQIRIGIDSGSVIAGVIDKRLSYELLGNTIDTAVRMAAQGPAGRIQVTAAIYKLLKHKYRFEKQGMTAAETIGTTTYWLSDQSDSSIY